MKLLHPSFDLPGFLRAVKNSERPVLLLDYDGTLAPFRPDRNEAVPYQGIRELLSEIISSGRTNVAVITGRTVDEVMPLLAIDPAPEIWGSHGLERQRTGGTRETQHLSPEVSAAVKDVHGWIEREHLTERAETKPSGAALHWRGLSEEEAQKLDDRIRAYWAAQSKPGLELHEFDGGLEMRVEGVTKGDAVRAIIAETSDSTPIAFFGDDRTDEDAFTALNGRGLSVLVRTELRPTAADLWVAPPDELLEFLAYWP